MSKEKEFHSLSSTEEEEKEEEKEEEEEEEKEEEDFPGFPEKERRKRSRIVQRKICIELQVEL